MYPSAYPQIKIVPLCVPPPPNQKFYPKTLVLSGFLNITCTRTNWKIEKLSTLFFKLSSLINLFMFALIFNVWSDEYFCENQFQLIFSYPEIGLSDRKKEVTWNQFFQERKSNKFEKIDFFSFSSSKVRVIHQDVIYRD